MLSSTELSAAVRQQTIGLLREWHSLEGSLRDAWDRAQLIGQQFNDINVQMQGMWARLQDIAARVAMLGPHAAELAENLVELQRRSSEESDERSH
jgi:hypothetical protein